MSVHPPPKAAVRGDPDGQNHRDHWMTHNQCDNRTDCRTGHESRSYPVEWSKHDPSLPDAERVESEVLRFEVQGETRDPAVSAT